MLDINGIPEVNYQYVIHCEDCGLLYINHESCNPGEAQQFDTVTYNLADTRKSIAAHKRYHKATRSCIICNRPGAAMQGVEHDGWCWWCVRNRMEGKGIDSYGNPFPQEVL